MCNHSGWQIYGWRYFFISFFTLGNIIFLFPALRINYLLSRDALDGESQQNWMKVQVKSTSWSLISCTISHASRHRVTAFGDTVHTFYCIVVSRNVKLSVSSSLGSIVNWKCVFTSLDKFGFDCRFWGKIWLVMLHITFEILPPSCIPDICSVGVNMTLKSMKIIEFFACRKVKLKHSRRHWNLCSVISHYKELMWGWQVSLIMTSAFRIAIWRNLPDW